MVTKVQRWSSYSCECVIEQAVDYDDQGNPISEVRFLMMNHVCDKHRGFASTRKSENHAVFSAHVLNLIEQAKRDNLKQVDDLLANPNLKRKTRRELERCRKQVLQFNNDLDEEWGELVEFNHAFDSHIHDMVLRENKEKQELAKQEGV